MTLTVDVVLITGAGIAMAAIDPPSISATGFGDFIKDIGFPIFVAIYVLVRLEGTMSKLTAAINKVVELVEGQK